MRRSVFTACIAISALAAAVISAGAQQVQPPSQQKPPAGTGTPAPPSTAPAPAIGSTAPAQPERYGGIKVLSDKDIKLSAGDVIQIQVENHPGLDGAYAIPGVGKLLLPEAGEVKVSGLTVYQFRDNLQSELEKTLNNVYVRVLLREVHSRQAAVTGYVLHQGTVDMATNEIHFLNLIDAAGGLAPPPNRLDVRASDYIITLHRGNASLAINLAEANSQPDGPMNFIVQPGDRVTVELHTIIIHQMHILGEIPRPGNYILTEQTNVLWLFGQSGFPSTQSSLSTAYVIRGSNKIPLDLRPLLTGDVDLKVNKFKFDDEDILFIPKVTAQYMVWGQAGRQGYYPYPEAGKVYLIDAINMAGKVQDGEYRKVQLIRTEDGKQKVTTINLDRAIRAGKNVKDENVLLKPNDIVFVPPRRHVYTPGITDIFTPIAILGAFGIRPY